MTLAGVAAHTACRFTGLTAAMSNWLKPHTLSESGLDWTRRHAILPHTPWQAVFRPGPIPPAHISQFGSLAWTTGCFPSRNAHPKPAMVARLHARQMASTPAWVQVDCVSHHTTSALCGLLQRTSIVVTAVRTASCHGRPYRAGSAAMACRLLGGYPTGMLENMPWGGVGHAAGGTAENAARPGK